MKTLKVAISAVGLVMCLSISTSLLRGKAEYTKKEKKACTYCHVKANSKDLNDMGNCYKKNDHSLKGCETEKPAEKKG